MFHAIENSLYVKDREKYKKISESAIRFNAVYNGNNIIQDDIFHVIENYIRKHDMPFELLRYPIGDQELCACTFIREERLFVVINAALPISKQIFAAAHELYHIFCYLEDDDSALSQYGSILHSASIDEVATRIEDAEANAFAGLLLAPPERLREQMRIYDIHPRAIQLDDIIMLMEIFAIPYKAVVLRLFEDEVLTEDEVRTFFVLDSTLITKQIELTGRAERWQTVPNGTTRFGSLLEMMDAVKKTESVREERYNSDMATLAEIKKRCKSQ